MVEETKLAEVSKTEEKTPPASYVPEAEGGKKPFKEDTNLQSVSFKEESNLVADLLDPEKKILNELKQLIQAAIANNEFNPSPNKSEKPSENTEAKTEEPVPPKTENPPAAQEAVADDDGAKTVEAIAETVVPPHAATVADEEKTSFAAEEVFLWGVPLLGSEKSDTVLLKFLRARDFKAKEALAMIKNAVIWRKQFGVEALLEEDVAFPELEKVVFYHGKDKDGHPVCYNVYGEFQDQELYDKVFGDKEKREKFLKWRILLLEKGIRKQLNFEPGKVCTLVQVTDLKNVPGPGKKELRQATKKALALLQDNYPEFVAKQVFINVPWWYLAYNMLMSRFFSQRTKSKFVFAGPSKSAETLFKYIAPEFVPIQYGGMSKHNDADFSTDDTVNEITLKPSNTHFIEFPVSQPCLLFWELRVLAWDVSYGAEFTPSDEGAYTVILQKVRKLTSIDEPYVKNSFKVSQPGKIVITIDNVTTKKKKLLYRWKTKASTEST
ncbi:hypothetical protein HPP92_006595 [Vanilla planifolia]|uniref:Patellin-3 n=1 Tax=Vanilla planifolia TaxID=51239 RepID=A0A835V847_VANPL|nr:hypothetical protein HPP92_006859 [Vanilla planifolia]KAG0489732.1 hypothetical protein HPP92_006595 [Vanilla planifolia]